MGYAMSFWAVTITTHSNTQDQTNLYNSWL